VVNNRAGANIMPGTLDPDHAQLFLDDTWIADSAFVTRTWHQARKFPDPVVTAEHLWEQWAPVLFGTVLHWRGRFRMWYCAWTRNVRPRVCYAESEDGVNWTKPELGICEFNGSTANNIVLCSAGATGLIDDITVIDDPTDDEWPLKMLYWDSTDKVEDRGIFAARSRDGIQWDRSPGRVLPWGDRFNALSCRRNDRYLVFGRAQGTGAAKGRAVWRAESTDLVNSRLR